MKIRGALRSPWRLVLCSALCAAGMWLYVQRVLVKYQIADAAAHSRPRGNLSDLYPRWLGARELLLHGRDPYSADVTRDIQSGFYGRSLDPSRPQDPKDQEAFAYPVYVVFYLAPTVHWPFEVVRSVAWVLLAGLTVASVFIWLRLMHWGLSFWEVACVLSMTLSTLAVVQALKLQQLTLLVAALLALATFLFATERPISAGFVIALATIKPQVVCGMLLWIGIWTIGDWRRRYHWAVSFAITMAVLAGGAEFLLPHWVPRFLEAVRQYRIYASAAPIFDRLLPTPWSQLAEAGTAVGAAMIAWRNRHVSAESDTFILTTCMVLSATLLTIPSFALYNQVLLLPAVLVSVRDRKAVWEGGLATRLLAIMVLILLAWQWVSSAILALLSFMLPTELVQKGTTIPFWTALALPVAVSGLMLLVAYRGSFPVCRKRIPA